MIRHIGALAALAALSLGSVACTNSSENEASGVEETNQDLVSRSAYFETFQGDDGHFYFSMMAANGAKMLGSQAYTTLASAKNGVRSVLANGENEQRFVDHVAGGSPGGEHYFDLKAANGQVIATSSLYASKSNADHAARVVRGLVHLTLTQEPARTEPAPHSERFEIFTGEDHQTYFRLRAGNGEILLTSEGYVAKSSAHVGIASVEANGVDPTHYEVAPAADGSWLVRLVADNGEIIARAETYANEANALHARDRMTEILRKRLLTVE